MRLLRQLIVVAATLGIVLTAVGCNTIHGFGRDVEEGGEGIQDVSEEAQESMQK